MLQQPWLGKIFHFSLNMDQWESRILKDDPKQMIIVTSMPDIWLKFKMCMNMLIFKTFVKLHLFLYELLLWSLFHGVFKVGLSEHANDISHLQIWQACYWTASPNIKLDVSTTYRVGHSIFWKFLETWVSWVGSTKQFLVN